MSGLDRVPMSLAFLLVSLASRHKPLQRVQAQRDSPFFLVSCFFPAGMPLTCPPEVAPREPFQSVL